MPSATIVPLRLLLLAGTVLVASLGLAITEQASAGTTGDLSWSDNGTSVTITGCDGPCALTLEIPATIDTGDNGILPVTSISGEGFQSSGVTSITFALPSNLTSIGGNAFRGSHLNSIALPEGLVSIANEAFYGTRLTTIAIPSTVTDLSATGFSNVPGLASFTVANTNPAYKSVDGVLFNKAGTTLIQYPAGDTSRSEYTVPAGVTTLGDYAFLGAPNLTSIALPSSVAGIGDGAFDDVPLTDFDVDAANATYKDVDGVLFDKAGTTLLRYPVARAGSSYTVPSSVTTIGNSGFRGASLTSIDLALATNLTTIGDAAFQVPITSIDLPNTVTSIGDQAFRASGLTSIRIPGSVTHLGAGAFWEAERLATITFDAPSSLTSISDNTFQQAIGLTSIVIPSSVTSIGGGAFGNTTSLASVTFAASSDLRTVGEYSFAGTPLLTTITLPDTVTSIGSNAFQNSGVATVTLPSNPEFTMISNSLFEGATTLTGITVPDSVTRIGYSAFKGTTALSTAVIGGNVQRIDASAFQNSGLTSIRLPQSLTTLGDLSLQMPNLAAVEFLGDAPGRAEDDDGSTGLIFGDLVGAGAVEPGATPTVYRFANATGWPDISLPFQGRPQALLVALLPPTAVVATAGIASATIDITAPTRGLTPDGYIVTAVQDGNKTCTIAAPATSCTIAGLAVGTTYTFTARSTTTSPSLTSEPSAASNAITPLASPASAPSSAPTSTAPAMQPARLPASSSVTATSIATTFVAPGPGIVTQRGTTTGLRRHERAAGTAVCSSRLTILEAGRVTMVCRLSNAARRARLQRALTVTLTTTFTPTSGTPMVLTKTIRLARTPLPKTPTPPSTAPSSVTG